MADKQTAYYLDAVEANFRRNASPSMAQLTKDFLVAEFDITLVTGSLAVDDNYLLGKLGVNARIFPLMSYIVGTSGAVSGAFRLEKITTAGGTPTTVGGNATILTDNTAVAFATANGVITKDEYLQLTINTATEIANGDTLKLYVVYVPTDAVVVY